MRSSQRSFVGNLKPCGGGPAGVAARKALEEKAVVGGSRYGREWMGGLVSVPEGRQCAKSVVAVLLDAILWVGLLRREGEQYGHMYYLIDVTVCERAQGRSSASLREPYT